MNSLSNLKSCVIVLVLALLLFAIDGMTASGAGLPKPESDNTIKQLKAGNSSFVNGQSNHPQKFLAKVEADPVKAMNVYADTGHAPDAGGDGNVHGTAQASRGDGGHGVDQAGHGGGHGASHAQPIELISPEKLSKLDEARHHKVETPSIELDAHLGSSKFITWVIALGVATVGVLGFGGWKFSHKLRLRTRLYTGFGVMAVLTVATGLGGMYFLYQASDYAHQEFIALDLGIKASELGMLQYEFVLIGIADHEKGEHLLEKHQEKIKQLVADANALDGFDLDATQAEALDNIRHEVELYGKTFHTLVKRYHEIEEIKEHFEELAVEVDHQLAKMLHQHEAELENLESQESVSMPQIRLQTQMVEKLAEAELLVAKIAFAFAEFMLDKRLDHITTAEQEFGQLYADLTDLRGLIAQGNHNPNQTREELALLDLIEVEIKDYQKMFGKVVEDELAVSADLLVCEEELEIVKATGMALAHQAEKITQAIKKTAVSVSITLIVLGVLIGVMVAFLISSSVIRPIDTIIARIKDIAEGEGDLTRRIKIESKDKIGELGGWFNQFVKKVHDIVAEVSGVTREVVAASTEIATSSDQMSQGMNDQNQQMFRISAAIEEMSASVVEVARKSGDAASNAAESGKVAQEGGAVVDQTIEGMRGISEAVTAGAASVAELGKRGEQIGKIIDVINDIADQTNLLALNAAIEAARAGEHGRGFAVVADEVRKLADRTTKATDEIAESIKAIQSETGEAVHRMNAGTEQVSTGVERATEAGESLKQIVANAQEVAGMIQSIAAAAEQQSAASEEVSRNVEGVSEVSRQSGEGARQAAVAAAQLSTQAEQLQRLVGTFKIDPHALAGQGAAPQNGVPHQNQDHLREAAKAFRGAV